MATPACVGPDVTPDSLLSGLRDDDAYSLAGFTDPVSMIGAVKAGRFWGTLASLASDLPRVGVLRLVLVGAWIAGWIAVAISGRGF